jgi:hypothetical protein
MGRSLLQDGESSPELEKDTKAGPSRIGWFVKRTLTLAPLALAGWLLLTRILPHFLNDPSLNLLIGVIIFFIVFGVVSLMYWGLLDEIDALDIEFIDRWVEAPWQLLLTRIRGDRTPTDEEWEAIAKLPEMPYTLYLDSDAWKARRSYMVRRAGHRCQVCNSRERLEVHHRTYDRLGHERIDDLTVLCHECHGDFHASGRLGR